MARNVVISGGGTGIGLAAARAFAGSGDRVLLLGRRADGSWITPAMISSAAEGQTRPVLLIDPEQRKLHVFTSTEGGGNIYYKQSSMDTIAFPSGLGTKFIESGSGINKINNPTSTKQTVNSATGLRLTWFVYRGQGAVTFDPPQFKPYVDMRDGSPWTPGWQVPPVPADNRWITRVTFGAPGRYTIRCLAHDGMLPIYQDVTVDVS